MMTHEKILIIDDNPANIRLLSDALERHGHEILTASDGDSGLRIASLAKPALILLDVMMPLLDGMATCRSLKRTDATREIPVIFITARHEMESLVAGFRSGAVDYIHKPFHLEEVLSRVETHLQIGRLTRQLRARNDELEKEIERRRVAEEARRTADERYSRLSADEAARWGIAGFVGESRTVRKIVEEIKRVHRFANTGVLIQGESGTGKELVARALHHGSPRSAAPFIPVNCVAIPAELAESMLFGHVRGAFTGATIGRKGWFELANNGTLFLDEIGDMPLPLQGKLLRALEDGEIHPVGGAKPIIVDVRVIAATNADVPAKIVDGSFRQDLFFRLARYVVDMPPLRERLDDLPLLVSHFLRMFSNEMGMSPPAVAPEAMTLLESYSFPGNVRELKNIIERALIESGGGSIQRRHIHLLDDVPKRQLSVPVPTPGIPNSDTIPLNLDAAEQMLIQRALNQAGGNVAEAARLLGVNRSRIYRRFPNQV
ncbi:MAG TPA: sigma-54 dependent transcriptional regulator [Chthoniobacterales bacterium]